MKRPSTQSRFGPLFAVAFASVVASLAFWLLVRPARGLAQLSVPTPRPELLDRPHRHQFATPTPTPTSRAVSSGSR
jgi:hypothetical protein